jgi:hypothetical protein
MNSGLQPRSNPEAIDIWHRRLSNLNLRDAMRLETQASRISIRGPEKDPTNNSRIAGCLVYRVSTPPSFLQHITFFGTSYKKLGLSGPRSITGIVSFSRSGLSAFIFIHIHTYIHVYSFRYISCMCGDGMIFFPPALCCRTFQVQGLGSQQRFNYQSFKAQERREGGFLKAEDSQHLIYIFLRPLSFLLSKFPKPAREHRPQTPR